MMAGKKKGGDHLRLEVLRRSPGAVKTGHNISRFQNHASRRTSSRSTFWKVVRK